MLSSHAELLRALGWTLLHSLWQGAVIAALLFVVNLFVKRSEVRYVLACVALLLMLVAPAVTFALLYDKPDVPVVADNHTSLVDVQTDVDLLVQPVQTDDVQTIPVAGQPHGVAPTEPLWRLDWRERLAQYLPYIVLIWLAGVVLLSLRLLLQWVYAERFKRKHTWLVSAELQQHFRALALRLRVSRPVRLLESSLVDAPTVIGFLKPVVLLPTSALTGLSVQQLESLLIHELAHIRRHDYLVNILQSVVETLLFYHPAVWWVSYRIRVEREHCCDDVAVKVTGNALEYAKVLERLETLRQQPRFALAANDGKLVNRIRRLVVQPGARRHFSASWLVSFATLAVLMLGAGLWLYPQFVEAQDTTASLQVFDRNGKELTEEIAPHAFGMIRKLLTDKFGSDVLERNLKVYSTIDLQAQLSANEASLNAEMPPGAQMAVVGIDPSTGGVLAMVGGYLKEGQEVGKLNRAAQTYRQPGHSFSPIAYATAMEVAGLTQATILVDEPTTFKQSGLPDYKPGNHDNTFMGPMTIRKSLDISRNITAVKAMEIATPDAVVEKANVLGYENVKPFWSLALGSNETTPLQHAAAYGAFANAGVYIEPHIISRVEDAEGKVIFEVKPAETRVWSEQTAYMTLDLLHGNVVDEGAFSRRAAIDGRYVAGKTGTTNDERDIWFVGMTPGIVAAVWIGFDDNSRIPKKIDPALTRAGDGYVTSSRQPVYIWKEFVEGALEGQPVEEYPVPEGITFKNIDLTTGGPGGTRVALPDTTISQNGAGLEQVEESTTQPEPESTILDMSDAEKREAAAKAAAEIIDIDIVPFSPEETNDQTKLDGTSSISFTSPVDNAQVAAKFREWGSCLGLSASTDGTAVKAMQDGVILDDRFLSSNDGYLVVVKHKNGFITAYSNLQLLGLPEKGQSVKQGDVIGYMGGGYLLPKNAIRVYVRNPEGNYIDPLEVLRIQNSDSSDSKTDDKGLESNRVYEQPYLLLPEQPKAVEVVPNPDDIVIYGYSDEDARAIPFIFDPASWGIAELLEQPYTLRVTVQDALGERDLLERKVAAAESVEASLQVYGNATLNIFINDELFSSYNP